MRPCSLEALAEPDARRDPAVHKQDEAVAPALHGAEPPALPSLAEEPRVEAAHDPPLSAPPLHAAGEAAGPGAAHRHLPAATPAEDTDLREPWRGSNSSG